MDEEESETTVPLVEERFEPRIKQITEEVTIVKVPIKETKYIDVELTHEELVLKRKTLSEPRKTR